jgi:tetratricopeptide (TPR) repeat protein
VLTVPVCLVHQGVGPAAALAASLLARTSSGTQRLAVRLEQANVALAAQDLATLQRASQAALQEAAPGSPAALRAQALHATALAFGGEHKHALQDVRSVQQGLPAVTDARLAAELQGHCAMVFSVCGRTRDCVGALQQQLRHAGLAGDMEQEAIALSSLAGQGHNLGDTEAAMHSAQQAAVLHRRLASAGTAFANDLNLANILVSLNRYGQAHELLDAAFAYGERTAASNDLRQVVAEIRAALWLRLGHPVQAQQALDSAPAPTAPRRQLQQLMLRAQMALLQGQAAQARQHWLAMQPLLKGGGDTVLTLAARALLCHCLGGAGARAQLDAVVAMAVQAEFPAAQAQALMARAHLALAAGDHPAALADAHTLWALRPRARHLVLDEGVLCATVCAITDACADATTAKQTRQRAVQAFVQPAQAHVPAADLDRWRAHALRRALWTAAAPGPAAPHPIRPRDAAA